MSGLILIEVICGKRRAYGAAGIAGSRLNPESLYVAIAKNLAVADTVQHHTAGHTEIPRSRGFDDIPRES
jgi:hypothetical protein